MATVRWSLQAHKELEAISDYYREASSSYAERFEEKVFEATKRLEVFPRSGRVIPESEDEQLLTILHSSRQFGGFE